MKYVTTTESKCESQLYYLDLHLGNHRETFSSQDEHTSRHSQSPQDRGPSSPYDAGLRRDPKEPVTREAKLLPEPILYIVVFFTLDRASPWP